ncbi:hypothetical protein BJ322DRAFT_1024317 [Thelephora terrestris]|uniref:Uncharacterized protein n=1 Tax=Thelephora terrestris TaxID=56493 RepID=A0A9P6H5Y2_9AGAM|nr:hypothetical protein BJ322DRAFT_1024317 [Thelephora terrestris]
MMGRGKGDGSADPASVRYGTFRRSQQEYWIPPERVGEVDVRPKVSSVEKEGTDRGIESQEVPEETVWKGKERVGEREPSDESSKLEASRRATRAQGKPPRREGGEGDDGSHRQAKEGVISKEANRGKRHVIIGSELGFGIFFGTKVPGLIVANM